MSSPTPAKRRHLAGSVSAKQHQSSDKQLITTEIIKNKLGSKQTTTSKHSNNNEEATTTSNREEEEENRNPEGEEEFNLKETLANQSVNAKIGLFERLSLADQRLLLLSASSNTCDNKKPALIASSKQQNRPTNGLRNDHQHQLVKSTHEEEPQDSLDDRHMTRLNAASEILDHYLINSSHHNVDFVNGNHYGLHDDHQLGEMDEDDDDNYSGLDTIIEEDETTDSNCVTNEAEHNIDSANNNNICDQTYKDCPDNGRQGQHQQLGVGQVTGDHTPTEQVRTTTSEATGERLKQQRADNELTDSKHFSSHQLSPTNECASVTVQSSSIDYCSSSTTNESSDMPNHHHQSNEDKDEQQDGQEATSSKSVENNSETNDNKNKAMELAAAAAAKKQLLPSTNRLISEHQARQQQATLFRVLSERQRLLDELTADERMEEADLMSGHFGRSPANRSIKSNKIKSSDHQDRSAKRQLKKQTAIVATNCEKRRRKGQQPASNGVPLSSVDLSSMSDRMLEELLGHIASASSSSASSSCDSSSSSFSDLVGSSSNSDNDDDFDHQQNDLHRTRTSSPSSSQQQPLSSCSGSASSRLLLAPSVIGVHEDEQASPNRLSSNQRQHNSGGSSKCREAHRRSKRPNSEDDGDDEDDLHRDRREPLAASTACTELELASNSLPGGATCSLSPRRRESSAETRTTATKNWQQGERANLSNSNSVEAVLGRMLEALNEASDSLAERTSSPACQDDDDDDDDDDEREHLNELLERGFLHLEQLLNCSLTSAATFNSNNSDLANSTPQQTQQVATTATPLTSRQAQTLLSSTSTTMSSQKDSDYGSDTQSGADCFLSSSTTQLELSGTPCRSQVATVANQQVANGNSTNNKTANLSPLAIELSFKLAESLRNLAQRQQDEQRRLLERGQQRRLGLSGKENEQQEFEKRQVSSQVSVSRVAENDDDDELAPMQLASLSPAPPSSTTPTTPSDELLVSSRSCSSASSSNVASLTARRAHRAPMRSIVMISSPDCCDAATAASGPLSSATTRNTTPAADELDHQKQSSSTRREPGLFRTRVNINSSGSRRQASSTATPDGLEEEEEPNLQVIKVVSQPTFERRRSLRSSLRRRPSLKREPGAPRPASPRPQEAFLASEQQQQVPASSQSNEIAKILLEDLTSQSDRQDQVVTKSKEQQEISRQASFKQRNIMKKHEVVANQIGQQDNDEKQQVECENSSKHQRQLQRALVLAQKYNYSPAKLAASKLGSKLGVVGVQQQQKQQQQQDRSKSGKRKSSIKRHDLDPQFDQRFTFGPVQLAEFDGRVLWLSVWHKDRLGKRNEFLGELLLPLSQVRQQLLESDLCLATPAKWYSLSNARVLKEQHQQQQQSQSTSVSSRLAHFQPAAGSKQNGYCSPARLQQQQAAEQVARKLNEFERKAQQLAANAASSGAAYLPSNLVDKVNGNSDTNSLSDGFFKQQQQRIFTDNSRHSKASTTTTTTTGTLASSGNSHNPLNKTIDGPSSEVDEVISNEIVKNLTVSRGANGELEETPTCGQLFVALKFVAHSTDLLARRSAQMEGELRVLIKEAKNLVVNQQHKQQSQGKVGNQLPSPQCKCYLLNATGQRLAKQKTQQLKKTSNPLWNQELNFVSLRLAQLVGQALEIQVINRDPISSITQNLVSGQANDYDSGSLLGGIRLCRREDNNQDDLNDGEKSTIEREQQIASEREAKLWSQMLERPNIWVYGQLPLRQLRPLISR